MTFAMATSLNGKIGLTHLSFIRRAGSRAGIRKRIAISHF